MSIQFNCKIKYTSIYDDPCSPNKASLCVSMPCIPLVRYQHIGLLFETLPLSTMRWEKTPHFIVVVREERFPYDIR